MSITPQARLVTSADRTAIGYVSLGQGESVVVIGGALRTAEDYLPFASSLAQEFEVHVMDRRGRGSSGPQGADYAIAKECEDLRALLVETGATRIFGHSFGGMVALEAAKRLPRSELTHLAVYEPGLAIGGAVRTGWMAQYAQRLTAGDRRGAFAAFVRGSGHAPGPLSHMPLACLKPLLRIGIRDAQWRRMEPLLEANLREHEQLRDAPPTLAGYATIDASVLLMIGERSREFATRPVRELAQVLETASLEVLSGLAHNAPDDTAPEQVAMRVIDFLRTRQPVRPR